MQGGLLLNVFGNKVGIFLVKIKNGVSTNVLSKSNHTHGGGITEYHAHGKSRIGLGFDLLKAIFYARVHLKESIFSKISFLVPSNRKG